jgi:hypothetical protein
MVRRVARILLALAALVVAGFVIVVLIGVWSRYEQKSVAADFSGNPDLGRGSKLRARHKLS